MSREEYITLSAAGTAETVIEKSRFIGYAAPAADEEEARAVIEKIKREHYAATHNCFAYTGGPDGGVFRYSDDGEPQGTAGMPILEVLKGEGVFGAVIVVTRYFGGIKLGTGGLCRAYSRCAKEALAAAEKAVRTMALIYDITLGYDLYKPFETFAKTEKLTVLSAEYGEHVKVGFAVEKASGGGTAAKLTDFLGGKARPVLKEEKYFSFSNKLI